VRFESCFSPKVFQCGLVEGVALQDKSSDGVDTCKSVKLNWYHSYDDLFSTFFSHHPLQSDDFC